MSGKALCVGAIASLGFVVGLTFRGTSPELLLICGVFAVALCLAAYAVSVRDAERQLLETLVESTESLHRCTRELVEESRRRAARLRVCGRREGNA